MKLAPGLNGLLCGAIVLSAVGLYTAPASAKSIKRICDEYAYNEARSRGKGRVLGGSAVGAAAGAIIGGIAGGGRGAAIGAAAGAATGAIGGAASKRIRRSNVYRMAYDDCIAARTR